MNTTSRPARIGLATGLLALTALLVAGCGAEGGDSGSSTSDSADSTRGTGSPGSTAAEAPALAGDGLAYDTDESTASDKSDSSDSSDSSGTSETSESDAGGAQGGQAVESAKAVISTGTVSLRSKDVGQVLFDVQKVVDVSGGEITERNSETDDDGDPLRSRLVIRVPADRFGDTMGALEKAGTLISSNSSSEDVTTQVIDTNVRVDVQRASIDRIQALLAQATTIKDIVSIEAQLTSRQAELNSLEQTQTYLSDQTSRSTITVTVERTSKPYVAQEKDDDSGFLAGLTSGWDALSGFGVALATITGTLLPWLILLGILAVPGVLLTRRLRGRGRRTSATPTVAPTT